MLLAAFDPKKGTDYRFVIWQFPCPSFILLPPTPAVIGLIRDSYLPAGFHSGGSLADENFDPTWTSGGLPPYVKIEWDFDGDSVVDETVTGSWATPADLPATSYIYECAGIYAPSLTITESTTPEPLVQTDTKIGYIEVTGRKGDFDNDNDIDIFDFVYFADVYGT